ncbi:hypothetical protein AYO40_02450 [Planctomycetaceae bacterium SCGC AG-212-D15]|nr:hypothetical protein AYO40_02450 [Planctomycetaceae bacterium SCGC AG-212-D15]
MKGFITGTMGSVCLLGGLVGMVGCTHYRDLADPCWPERYNAQARQEVREGLTPQVQNGHVLDQTVWDSHFKVGSSELTPGGIEQLNYLLRRRPCPDNNVYVQTAQILPTDVASPDKALSFNPATPEKMIETRNKLNQERKEAVERYLVAAANGRNLKFNIETIDVATPGMSAIQMNSLMRIRLLGTPAGSLPSTGGAGASANIFGSSNSWQ